MLRTRVIPVLLLDKGKLVKGSRFQNHRYVGDPINTVRILNEKEVDEIVFLDISARNASIDFTLLKDIASEAFMPFAYGGGIKNLVEIKKLLSIGVEKVILNSSAYYQPDLVRAAADELGSQSVVVCVDLKKNWRGKYSIYIENGRKKIDINPLEYIKKMESLGAGELIISSIDREGTGTNYDLTLTKSVATEVGVPVIALGGAACLEHFKEAITIGKASSVAASDMFVFYGKHKAVLITYPSYDELEQLFRLSSND